MSLALWPQSAPIFLHTTYMYLFYSRVLLHCVSVPPLLYRLIWWSTCRPLASLSSSRCAIQTRVSVDHCTTRSLALLWIYVCRRARAKSDAMSTLVFWGGSMLFCVVVALVCIPTIGREELLFPHSLSSCQFLSSWSEPFFWEYNGISGAFFLCRSLSSGVLLQ